MRTVDWIKDLLKDRRPDCTSPLSLGHRLASCPSITASNHKNSSSFLILSLNYKFKGTVTYITNSTKPNIKPIPNSKKDESGEIPEGSNSIHAKK